MLFLQRILAVACASTLIQAAAQAAPASLLDQVIENPGSYSQMCSMPSLKRWNVLPFPGYHRDWIEVSLSPQNVRKLRENRKDVLRSINQKLEAITPRVRANQQASLADRRLATKDWKADQAFQICCMALLDLNGSESLPALLRLEATLHSDASYTAPKKERQKIFGPYGRHVQVLSTIAGLLHNEHSSGVAGLSSPSVYDRHTRNRVVRAAHALVRSGHLKGASAMPARPDYY